MWPIYLNSVIFMRQISGSPAGFNASYATDGKVPGSCAQPNAGCWLAGKTDATDWIQIDFNKTHFVQDVTLDFRRDDILKHIDGGSWENIEVKSDKN